MATFEAQVEGLTSLTISSSGTSPTQAELTQFLTAGAKEIINNFSSNLLSICCANVDFTSAVVNSEAEEVDTGKILAVFAGTHEARKIPSNKKHQANDSTSVMYATSTDPVYYFQNSKLNVLPASLSCKYEKVQYPTVSYTDSSITSFPDEAEYLVVLYGAIKSLQNTMGAMQTNTAIDTTAIEAVVTELNKVDDVIVEASNKIDAYYTSIGDIKDGTELWNNTNKRFTVVRDALAQAHDLIDNNDPHADYDAFANLADVDGALSAMDAHLTDEEAILGANPSSGDINAALVLIKTAVDQAATAANRFLNVDENSVFGDEATFLTSDSQLTRVKDALDIAEEIIDKGFATDEDAGSGDATPFSAGYWLADEDTEMVQATISVAATEIRRAQAHLSEWTSIGDMRVKEVNAALAEAQGYTQEVQARLSYAQAYVSAANARRAEGEGRMSQLNATLSVASQELQRGNLAIAEINSIIASYKIELDGVPLYLQEASSYISQAQGYVSEIMTRIQREDQKYKWHQSQQAKLQQDYSQGLATFKGEEK